MAEMIIMPKTGMAMEEGTIVEWLKKEGDHVDKGEVVAEIETDKSAMELESDYEGFILKILYKDGTTVPVTQPIAWLGKAGEQIPTMHDSLESISVSDGSPPLETPVLQENTAAQNTDSDRIRATPAARRAASEQNVNLMQIPQKGRQGEIRERDVLAFVQVKTAPKKDTSVENPGVDPAESVAIAENDSRVPLTSIQRVTGKRMLESTQFIPMVTEQIKADVTKLLAIRQELNEAMEQKITVNDLVLFAVVKALKAHPRLNSVFDGDALLYKGDINIGFAVASPGGLIVPVIRHADTYKLKELSKKAKELSSLARTGKQKPDDMYGATFTVSNVGMYGITAFTPIINPPEAAILGVCAVEGLPRFIDGQLEERKIMGLSLTFDHRVVDGAESAVFLKNVKDLLESYVALFA